MDKLLHRKRNQNKKQNDSQDRRDYEYERWDMYGFLVIRIFCLTLFLARTRSKVEMLEIVVSGMSILLFQKGKESLCSKPPMITKRSVISRRKVEWSLRCSCRKKGQAQQADSDRLYHYYLNQCLKVPIDVLETKPSAMEVQRMRIITPQMVISTAYALLKAAQRWPRVSKITRLKPLDLEDILAHSHEENWWWGIKPTSTSEFHLMDVRLHCQRLQIFAKWQRFEVVGYQRKRCCSNSKRSAPQTKQV